MAITTTMRLKHRRRATTAMARWRTALHALTPLTELFVEFRSFVVGQSSAFAAPSHHLHTSKGGVQRSADGRADRRGVEDRVETEVSDTPDLPACADRNARESAG